MSKEAIIEYARNTYTDTGELSPLLLESRNAKHFDSEVNQLSWLLNNYDVTPELAVLQKDWRFIEIKRGLNRIHNLLTLTNTTLPEAILYQQFSQAQTNTISIESFAKIRSWFKDVSPEKIALLRTSAVITKSEQAVEAFKKCYKAVKREMPQDSVEFITDTLHTSPAIYPATRHLRTVQKRKLAAMHIPNSHLRHMLYTEGGQFMFKELRNNISNNTLTENDFNLWFLNWVVNITGFRGHISAKGSYCLNEPTALALFELKDELDLLYKNEKHDVLNSYLEKRAKRMSIELDKDLGPNWIYLESHIACCAQLSVEELPQVRVALKRLPKAQLELCKKTMTNHLNNDSCSTPTYGPAVLGNLIAELKQRNLKEPLAAAIAIWIPLYSRSLQAYYNKGELSQILCFKELAKPENVRMLIERDESKLELNISDNGMLILKKKSHSMIENKAYTPMRQHAEENESSFKPNATEPKSKIVKNKI